MNSSTPYETPNSNLEQAPPAMMHNEPKPSSPKVFGILHLVYAGLIIFGLIIGIITFVGLHALSDSVSTEASEALDEVMKSVGGVPYFEWALSAVSSIALLVAGIMLLKYKKMGRVITIVYSVITIIWAIVNVFISHGKQMGVMKLQMSKSDVAISDAALSATVTGTLVAGALVAIIYPVFCLIFLNRRKVKQALN